MLCENIKNLRKAKGLSQEELAIKLNVVRQTVSKWEKGLSVPDAEMLLRIAGELDTSVDVLLNETVQPDENSELKVIANKLEIINEQFAKHNETRRKTWRIIFVVVAVVTMGALLGSLVNYIYLQTALQGIQENTAIIGGADGPTSILLADRSFQPLRFIVTAVVAVTAVIGIHKTRKK